MAKKTGPSNIVLQSLINELKKRSLEQKVSLWKRIALDLERSTRQRRIVNLSKIGRFAKDNETVIVAGKVLGSGELNAKLTVAAFQFSEGAREKLEKHGAKAVSLMELSKESPAGKRIRIIG